MRKSKILLLLMACLLSLSSVVYAAESADDLALVRRLELARKIQEHKSSKEEIQEAVEQYLKNVPPSKRSLYSSALRSSLNYKALDKISIDAYAQTFTEKELEVMLEYYSKPESQSIAKKTRDYARLVYPEVIRMLDRAMMRVKTGGLE